MALLGTANLSAYLRKMALDGYVVNLDLPELREAVRLMGSLSNNINQIARRMHEGGSLYETEVDDIADRQKELKDILNKIMRRLDHLSG